MFLCDINLPRHHSGFQWTTEQLLCHFQISEVFWKNVNVYFGSSKWSLCWDFQSQDYIKIKLVSWNSVQVSNIKMYFVDKTVSLQVAVQELLDLELHQQMEFAQFLGTVCSRLYSSKHLNDFSPRFVWRLRFKGEFWTWKQQLTKTVSP